MQSKPIHRLLFTFMLVGASANAAGQTTIDPSSLHAAVLAIRTEQHLSSLEVLPALNEVAAAHATEMASHGQLSHVFDAGGTPQARVQAAGIVAVHVSQNIAAGRTPAGVIRSLTRGVNRNNIANANFTHVGYGIAIRDGVTYVAQILIQQTSPIIAAPTEVAPAPPAIAPVQLPEAPVQATPATPQAPMAAVPSAGTVGYWICSSSRWWYYPMPSNAVAGQQLSADMSVSGPPPGYSNAPCQNGSQLSVQAGGYSYQPQPQYQQPPPQYQQPQYQQPQYQYRQPRTRRTRRVYIGPVPIW